MIECFLVFIVSYIWHATGITIGYHRLLSHRALTCPKFVEYFFVLGGYLSFEGSPIWWSAIHRAHHKYVDTPLDPHSPRFGMAHSYYGWLGEKTYAPHIDPNIQCPDIVADPLYRMLEFNGVLQYGHLCGFAVNFAYRGLLWYFFGPGVAIASLLAGIAVLQIPLLLNLVCHLPKAGYKNFATDDDSVNVWWVGLLAMGEGWHNNHHAYPGSARSGMRAAEFDASWLILKTLKFFGLVGRLNEATFEHAEKKGWLIKKPRKERNRVLVAESVLDAAAAVQPALSGRIPAKSTSGAP